MLLQKILEFLSFLGQFWGNVRPCHRLELGALWLCLCYEPACAQRKVTVVLVANMHTLRSGEHTDLVIQIAILCSLISTSLCTFSAQFAIDNATFGTDNFQERLHWWAGTASSCSGTCPSVPQLGYATVYVQWTWAILRGLKRKLKLQKTSTYMSCVNMAMHLVLSN